MANEVEKSSSSPALTSKSLDQLDDKKSSVNLNNNINGSSNNNSSKMPPASSPPALSSWAPILFPPWNPTGLLPAAFYPAALRSLPK